MKFTQVAANAFEQIQLNAGVLLKDFKPETAELKRTDILGATTGGVSFTATPEFLDFGEDIDNVPNNTMELKKLDVYTAEMSGEFVTVSPELAGILTGAADVNNEKVTPRVDLLTKDFTKVWWVGDYSDKNGDSNGGFVAIELLNVLSTGGFQIKSNDKGKGTFSFTFTGHYSLDDINTVPFNIYVKAGTDDTPTTQQSRVRNNNEE